MDLNRFKDDMARELYDMTTAEAIEAEICIQCKKPAFEHINTQAGTNEYYISALCEDCWEKIMEIF